MEEGFATVARLYPMRPAAVVGMQAWLRRYGSLSDRLAEVNATLAGLRAMGELGEDDQLLHDTLVRMSARLTSFDAQRAHVQQDLDWTRHTAARVDGDDRARWERCLREIAGTAVYAALPRVAPQFGLVPLGADPESGLQEFWVIGSGDEPAREPGTRRIVFRERTGIVLVLIPAGSFWMGAQATDPQQPNHDPEALPDEAPPHHVTLGSFFLSKYEMTQWQWKLMTGGDEPSVFPPGRKFRATFTYDHPVENVSWTMSVQVFGRWGLALPTECQWEYACRARARTPWWTGASLETLRGVANLADLAAQGAGVDWGKDLDPALPADFDDTWVAHAPVHTMRANPFGLHHVHGNVWEWCRDGFASYAEVEPEGSDGLRAPAGVERMLRGGDYLSILKQTRASHRLHQGPDFRVLVTGVRPARAIE
jgi:formylglycine-generating enzyme required for sulfatase activity